MPIIIDQDLTIDSCKTVEEDDYYTNNNERNELYLMRLFQRGIKHDFALILDRIASLDEKLDSIIEKYELKKEIVRELTKLQVLNDLANTSKKSEPVTEVTEIKSVDVKTE